MASRPVPPFKEGQPRPFQLPPITTTTPPTSDNTVRTADLQDSKLARTISQPHSINKIEVNPRNSVPDGIARPKPVPERPAPDRPGRPVPTKGTARPPPSRPPPEPDVENKPIIPEKPLIRPIEKSPSPIPEKPMASSPTPEKTSDKTPPGSFLRPVPVRPPTLPLEKPTKPIVPNSKPTENNAPSPTPEKTADKPSIPEKPPTVPLPTPEKTSDKPPTGSFVRPVPFRPPTVPPEKSSKPTPIANNSPTPEKPPTAPSPTPDKTVDKPPPGRPAPERPPPISRPIVPPNTRPIETKPPETTPTTTPEKPTTGSLVKPSPPIITAEKPTPEKPTTGSFVKPSEKPQTGSFLKNLPESPKTGSFLKPTLNTPPKRGSFTPETTTTVSISESPNNRRGSFTPESPTKGSFLQGNISEESPKVTGRPPNRQPPVLPPEGTPEKPPTGATPEKPVNERPPPIIRPIVPRRIVEKPVTTNAAENPTETTPEKPPTEVVVTVEKPTTENKPSPIKPIVPRRTTGANKLPTSETPENTAESTPEKPPILPERPPPKTPITFIEPKEDPIPPDTPPTQTTTPETPPTASPTSEKRKLRQKSSKVNFAIVEEPLSSDTPDPEITPPTPETAPTDDTPEEIIIPSPKLRPTTSFKSRTFSKNNILRMSTMVTLDMIKEIETSEIKSIIKESQTLDIFSDKDYLKKSSYKVVILGGSCGKSCYVMRLLHGKFIEDSEPSVEASFYVTRIIENEEAHIELIDTSGDDAYSSLQEKWMRAGDGIVFLCNVTSKSSFDEIQPMMQKFQKVFPYTFIPRIIVATGIDAPRRVVTRQQLYEFAVRWDAPVVEVSAITGFQVEFSLNTLLQNVRKNRESLNFVVTPTGERKSKREEHLDPMIPNYLTSRKENLVGSALITNGYLVSTYNETGTLLVHKYDGKQLTYFHNSATIQCKRFRYPYIITLHRDGVLQIINCENRQGCVQHQLELSITKDVHCILFESPKLYLVSVKQMLVFDFPVAEDPVVIPIEGLALSRILEEGTSLMGPNRILFAGNFQFQVFSFDEKGTKLVLTANTPNKQETFIGINSIPPFILARTMTKLMVYNIDDGKCHEAKLSDAIVTSVTLDNNYGIIGDSNGLITIIKLSDAQTVNTVNTKIKAPVSSSSDNDKMGLKLETRVNNIVRTGRFLWVAFECSYVAVYDMFASKQSTPLADFTLRGFSMKSIIVENSAAVIQMGKKTDNDKVQTCHTLVWCPSLNPTNVAPFLKIKK